MCVAYTVTEGPIPSQAQPVNASATHDVMTRVLMGFLLPGNYIGLLPTYARQRVHTRTMKRFAVPKPNAGPNGVQR